VGCKPPNVTIPANCGAMIARFTLDSLDGESAAVAELYYSRVFRRFRHDRIPARNAQSRHEVSASAATPRLSIDGYAAHPIRADRLARALAARSGAPNGWTWRLADKRKDSLPATFRTPPAPYRERAYARGPGFCCVCGRPDYRFGWHVDLWTAGANKNATWHCACVVAWEFWNAPSGRTLLLRRIQAPLRSNQRAAVEQRRD
jgi:hypothetical protein